MTRILVIDDDRSVGTAIEIMLTRHGYDTFFATDPKVGVWAFESSAFDLVMVDIFMPGMDGLEAIQSIHKRSPAMPIVAMSGFRFRNSLRSEPDFLGMAAKFGATACLHKPFSPQQLMAALKLGFDAVFPDECAMEHREPRLGSKRC